MTDPISLHRQLSQLSASLKRVQQANVDLVPLGKLLPPETEGATPVPEDRLDTADATPVHRADDVTRTAEGVQRALQAVAREMSELPTRDIHTAYKAVATAVRDLHWILEDDDRLAAWGEATRPSELLGPLVTEDLLLALKHHGDEETMERFQKLPLAASGAARLGAPVVISEQIPRDLKVWSKSQIDAFCDVAIARLQVGRLGEKDTEQLEKIPGYFKNARHDLMQGYLAYWKNQPDSARRHAGKSLERDPSNGGAFELLGWLALQENDYTGALGWLVKLEAAEGTTLATLDSKSNLLKSCGRLSDAADVLRLALSLPSGDDANRKVDLAWNLLRLGTPATDPEVQGLLTEVPTEFGNQLLHAEALRRAGNPAASDLLRSLVESGESSSHPPANLMALAYFGLAQLGTSDALGRAQRWMDAATSQAGHFPSLHFRSGLFALADGDARGANAGYKMGLDRQPSVDILREALRELGALPASRNEDVERVRGTLTQKLEAALTAKLEPGLVAAEA